MPKRENESKADYKARKKAKKEKKRAKKEAAARAKSDCENKKIDAPTEPASSIEKKRAKKEAAARAKSDCENKKIDAPTEPASSIDEGNLNGHSIAEFQSFTDAPFAKEIQQALLDANFTKPSPIQSRAWPVALAGKDLIAVAKTGSGKTLGFLLPVFHRISNRDLPGTVANTNNLPSPLCVVLSPTRELAIQIHGECMKFGSCLKIRSECVYGGTNVAAQVKQVNASDPHVLIATPGRLCDLLERKNALSLERGCFCVLDESDRMLDMGFEKQLNQIMSVLPAERQTLFFTATWPKSVRGVARKFLREKDTAEIFVGEAGGELAANKAVTQTFVEAQDDEKDKKLYDILCSLGESSAVVVFCNTKRRVDYVANTFWREGFATCAVHGDKAQNERDASLQKFVKRERTIMVATDVAARGLDIKGVTHVINFDMARDVESYVHRIGRTGRAGEVGEAITFWNPDYDKACSPALVTIAKNAGQKVPPFLEKYERIKTNKQWKVADAEKVTSEILNIVA